MGGTAFSEVAERWLVRKAAKPTARPNSIHVCQSRKAHVVAYFGDTPIERIGVADLRAFLEAQLAAGRKGNTLNGFEALFVSVMALTARARPWG